MDAGPSAGLCVIALAQDTHNNKALSSLHLPQLPIFAALLPLSPQFPSTFVVSLSLALSAQAIVTVGSIGFKLEQAIS